MAQALASQGSLKKPQGSIAQQLLLVVLAIYLMISLVVTSSQLAETYNRAQSDLSRELEILGNSFKGALAKSLWEFDEEGVSSAVLGLLEIPDVIGVKVLRPNSDELIDGGGTILDQDGAVIRLLKDGTKVLKSDNHYFSEVFWQKFDVAFQREGYPEIVATAYIYSDTATVFRRIKNSAIIIVASELFEILAMWFLFMWASNNMLARPLSILTSATERLAHEDLKDFKVDIGSNYNNELKLLEDAFNSSAVKLYEAKDELENRMRLALNAGQIATWIWHPAEDRFEFDEHMPEIFGQSAHGFGNSIADIQKFIHEDDRTNFHESLNRALELQQPLKAHFRIVSADGAILHIEVQARSHKVDEKDRSAILVGTAMDVTERTLTAEKLEAAVVAAEQANKAKSEFLASMSHELRTPLNAILGFSEVLIGQHFGPPGAGKYREYASDIHKSGEHLLELVNDLLDLSSIEAGEKTLSREPLDISQLVEDCLHVVAEKARLKRISLTNDVASDLPEVSLDRRAMMQVLLNLLANSIKFIPPDGAITVSVIRKSKTICFSIIDDGPGIDAAKLADITDPFKKAGANPHVTENGWGLGLAISKSLVELHEGKMSIQSAAGQGTTVTIELSIDDRR